MLSNEDKIFRKQLVGSLNNIGKQLKRLADYKELEWKEDHHDYETDDADISEENKED